MNGVGLNGILVTDISDHFPIFHISHQLSGADNECYIKRRHINNRTMTALSGALLSIDWSSVSDCNDAESAYNSFHELFITAFNNNVPEVTVNTRRENLSKPWLSPGLISCIRKKNRMYYDSLLGRESIESYKKYKNKLVHVLRTAEKNYLKQILDINKTNMRKTWHILNKVIGKSNKKSLPSRFKINDRITSDRLEIANHFNNYFSNIGKSLAHKIPKQSMSPCEYLHGEYKSSIYLSPTTDNEVLNIIKNIKSEAFGWDGINSKILHSVSGSLLPQITHICNLSLRDGTFPTKLKIAKVVPIYKSGAANEVGNYRPISVLPVVSKIFEKLIYNRISAYIDKHSILSEFQFGFRKGKSSYMALNLLVDKLHQALNENKYTLGIYLDLSKAFDTLDHKILLEKLYHYGIRGSANTLIRNYLSDRKQYVH
jgi:hypothetical protein